MEKMRHCHETAQIGAAGVPADILCAGHAAYDLYFFLAAYPEENGKYETADGMECGGGPAANAAVLAARWGLVAAFAGTVGGDAYGRLVAEEFRAAGVDISLLRLLPGAATPVSAILVNLSNGSRTVVNRRSSPALPADPEIDAAALKALAPRVMLFDGHAPELAAAAMAACPEAITILDAGSVRPGTELLAPRVDYLIASEKFARGATGIADLHSPEGAAAALKGLRELNPRATVAITVGERGAYYLDGRQVRHVPALKVKAVDTTAAGDIFHGAFAYGLARGYPAAAAMELAAAAAGLSVTRRGGRPSIPALEEVLPLLSPASRKHTG